MTYRCPGQARKDVSIYLHHNATNYVAELHGIRVACTKIHADMKTIPPSERVPVYIFVDNQPAINAADGISRVRAQKRLVELVKQAVQTLRTVTSTTLLWVPGHAEIAGNDTADGLAKRGAKGNTSERKLIRFHRVHQYQCRHVLRHPPHNLLEYRAHWHRLSAKANDSVNS